MSSVRLLQSAPEAFDTRRRILGPEHPQTLVSMSNLAAVLADEHQFVEAERSLRETVGVKRRVLGTEDLDTIVSLNNLASVLNSEGKYTEAERLFVKGFWLMRILMSLPSFWPAAASASPRTAA